MSSTESTPADLFQLLWDSLTDVLGSAATATLLRRSLKRAALQGVEITRDHFEYRYVLPPTWSEGGEEAVGALRALGTELKPLLEELTGPVVLRRLESIPAIARCGLFRSEAG